jgi:hypothetical protein
MLRNQLLVVSTITASHSGQRCNLTTGSVFGRQAATAIESIAPPHWWHVTAWSFTTMSDTLKVAAQVCADISLEGEFALGRPTLRMVVVNLARGRVITRRHITRH